MHLRDRRRRQRFLLDRPEQPLVNAGKLRLDGLLNDLESMSAIRNSKFGLTILEVVEFVWIDIRNCYTQRLVLVRELELVAAVNDSTIL